MQTFFCRVAATCALAVPMTVCVALTIRAGAAPVEYSPGTCDQTADCGDCLMGWINDGTCATGFRCVAAGDTQNGQGKQFSSCVENGNNDDPCTAGSDPSQQQCANMPYVPCGCMIQISNGDYICAAGDCECDPTSQKILNPYTPPALCTGV